MLSQHPIAIVMSWVASSQHVSSTLILWASDSIYPYYISISSEIAIPKCGLRSDIPWTQHRLSRRPDPSVVSLAQTPMVVGSLMKPSEEMVGFVPRARANSGDRKTSQRVLLLMMSMIVGSESVKQLVLETTRSIVRNTDFWIAHMQEDDWAQSPSTNSSSWIIALSPSSTSWLKTICYH